MAFCEKCGAIISESMKFCDKCGSPLEPKTSQEYASDIPAQSSYNSSYEEPVGEETVNYSSDFELRLDASEPAPGMSEPSETYAQKPYNSTQPKPSAPKKSFDIKKAAGNLTSMLPASITKPGNKVMFFAGLASLAVLSLIYIICLFVFMKDISFIVGSGAVVGSGYSIFGGSEASVSNLWMIVYFILNLLALLMTGYIFLTATNKITKYVAVATPVLFMLITVFSLISWLICDAENFYMALTEYGFSGEFGTFAWYTLMDCLSEAWYLKIPLSLISALTFGLHCLVNIRKK